MELSSSSSANRAFSTFRRLLHACEQIQNPGEHEGLVSSSCTQATSLRHLKYEQYVKQLSDHFNKVQKLKDFGKYNSFSQDDMDDFARRVRALRAKSKALLAPAKKPKSATSGERKAEQSPEPTTAALPDVSPPSSTTTAPKAPIRIRHRPNARKKRPPTAPEKSTSDDSAIEGALNNLFNSAKEYRSRAKNVNKTIGKQTKLLDESSRLLDENNEVLEGQSQDLTRISSEAITWQQTIFLVGSALIVFLVTLVAIVVL